MGRTILSIPLVAMAIASTPASAGTLNLEPSSDWRLKEYDDKCRAIRTFGEGEDAATLWIDKAGASRFFNLTVIGRPFRSPFGPRLTLEFAPGQALSRGYVSSTSSKGRPVLTMFGVSPISSDRESANDDIDLTVHDSLGHSPEAIAERYEEVQAIELSSALIEKVSLRTGGLANMLAQLDQCIETLPVRRSNVSMGEGDLARRTSDRDTVNWAPQIQANYPSYLLRESAEGSVGLRVQVNPEGRASFCEVIEHVGPAGFNDAACLAMIRHARFHPALDRDGNAVWGTFATRVTYRIN